MFPLSKVLSWLAVAVLLVGTMTTAALHPSHPAEPSTLHADPPDPDPPDPFGGPLPRGAVARLGTLRFRHGRTNFLGASLTFTPDGKHLVSAGGGWVRRWDVRTGDAVVNLGDYWTGGFKAETLSPTNATADGRIARLANNEYGRGGSSNWQCREYDLASGKLRRQFRFVFPPATDSAHGLPEQLSPDGTFHLETRQFGPATLWDANGAFVHHLKSTTGGFTAHSFSHDGKSLLLGDACHLVHVYDLKTGLLQRTIGTEEKDHGIASLATSPDGRWLATFGGTTRHLGKGIVPQLYPRDRHVLLYDLEGGRVVHRLAIPEEGGVRSLLFSPDSRSLIVSIDNIRKRAVRTWDVASGKPGRAWTDDPSMVGQLAISPDGSTLATMNSDGVIRSWEMKTGREIRPIAASPAGLDAVCFVAGGKRLLTLGNDMALREWDAATGTMLRTTRVEGSVHHVPAFSASGRYVRYLQLNDEWPHDFRLHDTRTGKLALTRQGSVPVQSADDRRLAYSDKDDRVHVLDRATGKVLRTLTPPAGKANKNWSHPWPLGFSADGNRLILITESVSVFEVATGKRLSSWKLADLEILHESASDEANREGYRSSAVSADGELVAFNVIKERNHRTPQSERHDELTIVTAAGKLLHRLDLGRCALDCLAFSPDGKRLAGGERNRVHVYDVRTGKKLHSFDGHRGPVKAVAFSPDGTRLASASEDSTVLIWEVSGH